MWKVGELQSGTDQILPEIRGRPCSARPRWISKDMKEGADVSLEERVEVGWNSRWHGRVPELGEDTGTWGRLQFCQSLQEQWGIKLERGPSLLETLLLLQSFQFLALTVPQKLWEVPHTQNCAESSQDSCEIVTVTITSAIRRLT